jgi:hypothetical protein
LGSETGFPLWREEKARIRAYFLELGAFAFFVLFSSFRARERESAKKAPAPTSAHL